MRALKWGLYKVSIMNASIPVAAWLESGTGERAFGRVSLVGAGPGGRDLIRYSPFAASSGSALLIA